MFISIGFIRIIVDFVVGIGFINIRVNIDCVR